MTRWLRCDPITRRIAYLAALARIAAAVRAAQGFANERDAA